MEAPSRGRLHCDNPHRVNSTAPTLQLRGIEKNFGSVQALRGADFEVRDGEVMALVGDNGAGKSTLIKCVAGIYSIDGGEVLFRGGRSRSTARRTPPSLESRSSTRISLSATTSTSSQNMFLGREEHDPSTG